MTDSITIACPNCQSTNISLHGTSLEGKRRYKCNNTECSCYTFILDNSHPGRSQQVKQQILEMSLNGYTIRGVASALGVSTATVVRELKKRNLSSRLSDKSII